MGHKGLPRLPEDVEHRHARKMRHGKRAAQGGTARLSWRATMLLYILR